MKHIETILKRLISNPKYNGNMVEDTKEMYEETDLKATFKWLDKRTKPTWAELEVEYTKILVESKVIEASELRKEIEKSVKITSLAVEDFTLSIDGKGTSKLLGAIIVASKDPDSDIITDWKTESGWRKLKNSDIIAMAELSFLYVKNSFRELERIETEINNSDDVDKYEIIFDL